MSFDPQTAPNGLPLLGFGTYTMTREQLEHALPYALLKCNYRLIDTARAYRNEAFIGEVLERMFSNGAIKREEVFVTTKLAPADQGFEETLKAVDESLSALKLDFIDCYLIHWPGAAKLAPESPENKRLRRQSWEALELCVTAGKIKHIGISNYTVAHINELLAYATVKPHVHQFELHPLYFPMDIVECCQAFGIAIQAYASLGRAKLVQEDYAQKIPEVLTSAANHNRSIAQILLKWALQHQFAVIPKSTHHERILENSLIFDFELTREEMQAIDAAARKATEQPTIGVKFCWNPQAVA